MESNAAGYTNVREYTMCPNTLSIIGELDYSNKLISGTGSPAIPLRSNLHLKCGESGDRENNCVIRGGDVQIDGTNYFGLGKDESIENVIIEGFIFEQATRYSVWATRRGDITFIDCEWKDITEAYAPLYFDYFDASNRDSYLDVDFILCDFKFNRYFGDGAYPAMIVANGEQNRLNLERNYFYKNDFEFNNTQWKKNSVLVETGGQVTMKLNCFEENRVGVAPVVSYSSAVLSDGNFGTYLNETKCKYVASFKTQSDFDNFSPECTNYEEAQSCQRDRTSMPSASPSKEQTFKPSMSPTSLPSSSPTTSKPSASPSVFPSDKASLFPSSLPTSSPTTSMPSTSPSDFPSTVPSISPTTSVPSKNPSTSFQPSVSSKPSDVIPSAVPSVTPTQSQVPSDIPSEEQSSSPSQNVALDALPNRDAQTNNADASASDYTATVASLILSTFVTLVLSMR